MPPPLLIDLAGVDLDRVLLNQRQIYKLLPHRAEFMLLDGVCYHDPESHRIIAYRDVRAEDWWFRGHVPGRPLLPGVLMLEMAAHTAAVLAKLTGQFDGFIGFGGVDGCKFREPVTPPARLYLLSAGLELRPRRIVSRNQGVVDGRLIFETQITGLIMR